MDKKNKENETTAILVQKATIWCAVALFSSYFFTRGYIHSFSLPIRADFLESGYFTLMILSDGLLPIMPYFIGLFFIFILIIFFIIPKLKYFKRFPRFNLFKIFHFLKNKPLLKTAIIFYLFIFAIDKIFAFNWPSLFNLLDKIQSNLISCTWTALNKEISYSHIDSLSRFFFTGKVCSFFKQVVFKIIFFATEFKGIILCLSLIIIIGFSIFIFVELFSKKKNSPEPIKDILLFVFMIIIVSSSSYSLGKNYLGKFIHFPEYRTNPKTKEKIVQIWKGMDYYFYVRCKDYGVSLIEGVNKNNKIFYIGYLDKFVNPNVCQNINTFQSKTMDKKFTFYYECFYKNGKGELFPAQECLKIDNHFLIVPKGSLKVCYIDSNEVKKDGKKSEMFFYKKLPSSPSFSFEKQNNHNMCSGLSRRIYYRDVVFNSGKYEKNWNIFIKSKRILSRLKKVMKGPCPSEFLLYYNGLSKKEEVLDLEKQTHIKITEHFKKCN